MGLLILLFLLFMAILRFHDSLYGLFAEGSRNRKRKQVLDRFHEEERRRREEKKEDQAGS